MRKALIVGIDYYENVSPLFGCVNDAYEVKNLLERHSDGTLNFGVNLLTSTGSNNSLSRRDLKDNVKELFNDNVDIALFYFAGHGHIETTGGYLITSECSYGDDGFSMDELLYIANKSPARDKVIILDSCHSGIAGTPKIVENKALLTEGMTILTASSETQYASEKNGSGVFTSLLVDALNGSAANLVGEITPGSIYAHIDKSLGAWGQRPIFKTNVKTFTSLRKVIPPIARSDLRKIVELFDDPSIEFKLDPSFEPDSSQPIEDNTEKFKILQKYNRVNLVVPIGEDHMYYAAMNSKSCKLTVVGVHYWNLVKNNRI